MAQPFSVGDVVGGRYRITHHVVTSADQDIVFQGVDDVLSREVSILLAATSNAKQVATSAKELAAGERESGVQVLDLGLAEDRTYLISSLTDPNALLDLVVPDAAPYVEPFFTDSLGSELFGQSRVMEPETYEDDAEYYARLHNLSDEQDRPDDAGARYRRRRPAFLDKVSDQLNRRLGTEKDAERIERAGQSTTEPAGDQEDGAAEQNADAQPQTPPRPTTDQPTTDREGAAERGTAQGPADAQAGRPVSSDGQEASESQQWSGSARSRSDRPRKRPSAPFPIPMPPAAESARSATAGPGASAEPAGSALGSLPSSLADMKLVKSSARADTKEEFGVRAGDDGGFLPVGTVSFDGAAASPHSRTTAQHTADGEEAGSDSLLPPLGGSAEGPAAASAEDPQGAPSAAAHAAEGEEVVDDPPSGPVPTYDRPLPPAPEQNEEFSGERRIDDLRGPQQPDSFTGLIRAVPDGSPRAFPGTAASADSAPATEDRPEPPATSDAALQDGRPGPGRWFAAALLVVLVAAAAVITILFLGTAD